MAAKTNSSGDRKARIEAMRRAERSRERRTRILTIGASVLMVSQASSWAGRS